MAFDLSKAGFGVNRMQQSDKIIRIPLRNVHENEKNFYGIRDIEALAESIRESGLLDPIVVTQTGPQQYRIISGHRRFHAYSMLSEESGAWNDIPARVIETLDDPSEILALIGANATQRELTYDEKLKQEKACRDALEAMKASGKEVPRRLGEYIAEQLGTSRNEISRMHSVNENLIPEAREKVAEGTMNASEAYQMSRKPAEEQKRIMREPVQGPGMSETQKSVNDRIEENRLSYQEEYRRSMELLDSCLNSNLEFFLDDIASAANRQSGIKALEKWKYRCGAVNGYDYSGRQNGLQIKNVYTDYAATVTWTDLYDHIAIAAISRLCDESDELDLDDTPTREPKIIREQIVSDSWQVGSPETDGEYVGIFDLGHTEVKRICTWTDGAWYWLGGCRAEIECSKWIKLPEVD